MNTKKQFSNWSALSVLLIAIAWSGQLDAATVASVQSGDWENTATWDCGCVPGPGDNITVSTSTTVKVNTTRFTGNVTINGTLDTNDQFFEFEGNTFANNGAIISSTGSFGEIDFAGVGGVASTTQTISGTGSYSGGVSFPVEIHVNNSATLAPASGTILNNVRDLFVSNGATLSLPNVLVFQNGTVTSSGGSTISGAAGLQTKSTTTLALSGATTALIEMVNGTTTCAGNFGPITIDSGATLFQNGQVNANGNVTINGSLDMNDQFFEFEGNTFANNGAIISSTGSFGEIDFIGVGGITNTGQNISGTGSYSGGVSFPVEIHVNNSATLTPASSTVLNNVRDLFISNGATLSLPNVLVFQNGTVTSSGGSTISGAAGLQTKSTTTLALS
ncbi:MAG TPA: hypothetical protein VEI58_06000, partial [Chthoniobacterales bacterium]|nr:hypothetical protein [Chthoniobacterales bacterium]